MVKGVGLSMSVRLSSVCKISAVVVKARSSLTWSLTLIASLCLYGGSVSM